MGQLKSNKRNRYHRKLYLMESDRKFVT